MPINIAFFDAKPYDEASFNAVNAGFGFNITYYPVGLSLSSEPLARGADVVCIFVNDECNRAVIDALVADGVKLIALRCAGFNNVDLRAAQDRIPVVRVPAYSPHAVAEYAVTLMMCLNRKVHRAFNRTRDGNFKLDGLEGFDMYEKTVGVVGTGKIGKEVIKILHDGFGMRVLAYDLYPDEKFNQEHGVTMVRDLDELYAQSDIITLHCPLTTRNTYMINKVSISKMKPGVMIINTGRGRLIFTEDLIQGLLSRQIGAAGLDVYEEEKNYFYEDGSDSIIGDNALARLLMMPNVIVSSHQAFFTREALGKIALTTLQSVKELEEGKPLSCEVKQ